MPAEKLLMSLLASSICSFRAWVAAFALVICFCFFLAFFDLVFLRSFCSGFFLERLHRPQEPEHPNVGAVLAAAGRRQVGVEPQVAEQVVERRAPHAFRRPRCATRRCACPGGDSSAQNCWSAVAAFQALSSGLGLASDGFAAGVPFLPASPSCGPGRT